MDPFIWDEWPALFRGRLRVLYELTGEIPKLPRAPLPWYISGRRARLDYDVGMPTPLAAAEPTRSVRGPHCGGQVL